jgi:tetratricopeptide (TPR) repeat protein
MPKRIGQYHIKRVIASGGMGTVYEAVQEQPRRTVAVKLMRSGIASPSALRRFEYESQLLARLRHPGIAQVYQAGTHRDGDVTVPYFAMEYIPNAKPINQYVKVKNLGTRERLALVIQVCEAVHHGHQKGIIHRDLKPGNILVDSAGQVKVIDFGVARSTDSDMALTTLQTHVGQLIGTLQYMSPEQCEADPHDIDTRSDVYALGVVLYELLTGQLPYDLSRAAVYEATRVIREQQPTNPSTINRALRGDVETITLKALEKDRERRYQSASALTADIARYLNNQPIAARPASAMYQFRKLVARHKAPFAFIAVLFVLISAFGLWMSVLYTRAEQLRQEAVTARAAEQEQRERAEKTAGELKQVAEFQASQLSEIDTELMGVRLRDGLLAKRRAVLEDGGSDAAALEAGLQALESSLAGVNFTNVALATLDENIFERALTAIEKDFADQPLVKARLLQTVADTLRDLGLLDRATGPQTRALAIYRRVLGDDHPSTLGSISNMGFLLQAQGKQSDAEPYYRQALEGRRRVLGDDHPDTLTSINNMGFLLYSRGKLAEAEAFWRQALEGRRRVLGDDHPDTLASINNMGALLDTQGKLAEAEPYYREALEGSRRVLGDDHPDTLGSINNMGILLQAQEKLSESEPYYREALEGWRRVLGDDHPDTLRSIGNMGFLLQSQGKLSEAEPYYREALEGRRRVLGDDHPDTLRSIGNMGFLLQSQGKLTEAEPYYREALEGRRRVLGDDHPDTLGSINNMGALLRDLGRYAEAEELGAEAVRRARKALPAGHWFTAVFLFQHARTLAAMQRFAGGEAEMLEAHETLLAALGKDHERTTKCVESLAALYDGWHAAEPGQGYDTKAAEWRAKLPKENGE